MSSSKPSCTRAVRPVGEAPAVRRALAVSVCVLATLGAACSSGTSKRVATPIQPTAVATTGQAPVVRPTASLAPLLPAAPASSGSGSFAVATAVPAGEAQSSAGGGLIPLGFFPAGKDVPAGFAAQSAPLDLSDATNGGLDGLYQIYRVARPSGGTGSLAVTVSHENSSDDAKEELPTVGAASGIILGKGQPLRVERLTNGPSVGDEAIIYAARLPTQGSGYIILFRRGSYIAQAIMLGTPPPDSIDQLASIARALDVKLAAAPQ